jgi:plastocyanin
MDVIWQDIQGLWSGILDFTARLVIPDWAGLILLLPLLLAALVALFLVWLILTWAKAGPKRRGMRRRTPIPPPGVHAGSPSAAPVFAAFGAFLLVVTLILRGPFLVIGPGVLVLALLYWGREAVREYGHLEPVTSGAQVPAVVHQVPEGVHMPGPSFLPVLGALGALSLFAGLLFRGALLVAGVVVLVILLSGWMSAARHEWAATAEADRTGHVATGPRPGLPVGRLTASAVILLVAAAVNAGFFSVTGGAGGAGAGASPGASGGAGQASASAGPAADVTIVAHNIAYTTTSAEAPAGRPFTLAFDNQDANIPHDVTIHAGSPTGAMLFNGEIFAGVKTVVYNVPALPAGTYAYVCSVHPNMTGTLTVK